MTIWESWGCFGKHIIENDYPQCVLIYIPVRCTFGFAGLTISTKIIGTLSL